MPGTVWNDKWDIKQRAPFHWHCGEHWPPTTLDCPDPESSQIQQPPSCSGCEGLVFRCLKKKTHTASHKVLRHLPNTQRHLHTGATLTPFIKFLPKKHLTTLNNEVLYHRVEPWQLTVHHAITKEGRYSKHGQHGDCCYGDNCRLFVAKCAIVYRGETRQKQKRKKTATFTWEQQMTEVKHWLLIGAHRPTLTVRLRLPLCKLKKKDLLMSLGHISNVWSKSDISLLDYPSNPWVVFFLR